MIKAVTFDLWNTVLCERDYGNHRIGLLTQTLNEEGFRRDRHRVEVEYSSTIDFFFEVWMKERRHMPAAKLTDFILKRLDVHLSAKVKKGLVKGFEEAIFNDPPPLTEDVEKVLKSLHNRYRIGLISNSGVTPGKNLRKVLKQQSVLRYFQCTVFSDEVGYHKPHHTIFRRAVKKLQVRADEVIHIGDFPESDIVGAKAMGMKAVWLNKDERRCQPSEFTPDYEIASLSELLKILKE
ncbi:MAG: HAD family hydrolase [Candidatus Bathyarchaeota archaeon]|nr:MAG: HAD family hydrolase [Candidatus Bathyarchaeota archaeon]